MTTPSEQPQATLPTPALTAIVEALGPVLKERRDKLLASWIRQHRTQMKAVATQVQALLDRLEKFDPGADSQVTFWAELDNHYQELDEWVSRRRYLPDEATIAAVIPGWADAVDEVLAAAPDLTTRPIIVEELTPGNNAAWGIHLAARRERIVIALRTLRYRLVRREAPVPLRHFSAHLLVHHVLIHPLQGELLALWQRHLQEAARHGERVYQLFRALVGDLITGEEAEAPAAILSDPSRLAKWLEEMRGRLEELTTAEAVWKQFEAEAKEAVDGRMSEALLALGQAWNQAGTALMPARKFSAERLQAVRTTREGRLQSDMAAWREHFEVEGQDWHYDIALIRVQVNALKTLGESLAAVREIAADGVAPVFDEVLKPVREATAVFDAAKAESATELRRSIQREKRRFLPLLRDRQLPLLMDALVKARLEERVQEYRDALEQGSHAVQDRYRIFRRRDVEHIPPRSEAVDVPIAELLQDCFKREFSAGFQEIRRQVKTRLQHLLNGISEVDQVAEYNLDAALEILADTKDAAKAREALTEGLQRAANGLLELQREMVAFPQELQDRLIPLTAAYVGEVQGLLDNEKAISLELQLARARTRERVLDYRRRIWVILRRTGPQVFRYVRDAALLVMGRFRHLGQLTGLVGAPAADQQSLFQLLATTEARMKGLPYIYQRLFRIAPLTDDRFFSGREEDLSALGEAFQHWKEGHRVVTALVGERGSGRTTLLNFAERRYFGEVPVTRIDLAERGYGSDFFHKALRTAFPDLKGKTTEAVIAELNASDEPAVCILENLQYFYLKSVQGFEAIEALMQVLAKTGRRIFWVVTCTRYAWNYLDKVLTVGRSFTTVLELGQITPANIEAIILKRHRVTGFELEFEIPAHLGESRRFRRLSTPADQQAFLQNHCFSQLEKFGAGNITVTQLYWLISIRRFDDDRIVLYPDMTLDSTFLYELPPEELFALGAVLQHEALGVDDLARVLRIGEARADMLLTNLANRGILNRAEPGFMIHPFLYRPMVTVLKIKNIIH